jgi:hypothetical protein
MQLGQGPPYAQPRPWAPGKALRAIAEAMHAKGFKISREGVKGVLAAHGTTA